MSVCAAIAIAFAVVAVTFATLTILKGPLALATPAHRGGYGEGCPACQDATRRARSAAPAPKGTDLGHR